MPSTIDTRNQPRPDIDLTDGAFYAGDSRPIYRWMRENEPVFRDRNGLAAAATYQAVIDAERAPELFSNAGGIRPDQDAPPMMIAMDDPAHLLRRKLVNAGFTRKRVKDRESSIGALCDALIDDVCERGECDFVWDLAAPAAHGRHRRHARGAPRRAPDVSRWSDDMVTLLSSTTAQEDFQVSVDAFAAYTEYMTSMIAARKAEPTDDLVSVLVQAEVDGEKLADHDIVTEVLLLLIGGDETTRHTLSAAPPDPAPPATAPATGRRPALLPNAIEEMLRWTAPVKNMARTMTADLEFHGTQLEQGEKIILLFESANFDEAVFGDPEQLPNRPLPQQPRGIRLRHPLLPGESAGTPGVVDDARTVAEAPPRHASWCPRTRCRCGPPTSSAAWRTCRSSSRLRRRQAADLAWRAA